MAVGGNASSSGAATGKENKPPKRSIGQIIDLAAKAVVLIVGIPIRVAAAIVSQFVANGGVGRAVVGGVLFLGGSAISADSVWQTVFGQRPLFPWFGATRLAETYTA